MYGNSNNNGNSDYDNDRWSRYSFHFLDDIDSMNDNDIRETLGVFADVDCLNSQIYAFSFQWWIEVEKSTLVISR